MQTTETQKITVNVPKKLMKSAQEAVNGGITEAVIAGLEKLARQKAYKELIAMRGKVKFSKTWQQLKDDR